MMTRATKLLLLMLILLLGACSSAAQPESESVEKGGLPASLPPGLGRELEGRLLLASQAPEGGRLVEIDLSSGAVRTLYQAPAGSWLGAARVSPNGSQILLAYAPPLEEGALQFGYTDLYLMPYDASQEPQPFLQRRSEVESFFQPVWAPDGQAVVYAHLYQTGQGSMNPGYQNDIERADLSGQTRTLMQHAIWPALSPDGAKLAYLTAEPGVQDNFLYLAGNDGSSPAPVITVSDPAPVDDHFFTADGEGLIFSMVNPATSSGPAWWERLLGIGVALAHNVPSDWYYVPVSGGEPERLTQLEEIGLAGDLSPDGKHAAFLSGSGLNILDTASGEVIPIVEGALVGTVDWIP